MGEDAPTPSEDGVGCWPRCIEPAGESGFAVGACIYKIVWDGSIFQ